MIRNFICWDPGEVRQVINPYAEHISDSLFRAIHSDWDLKVSPPIGKSFQELSAASYEDMTPLDFVEDFLREDRPHALAAILGTTGSGKSHLVHWMRLNLKRDDDRMVLVVRKSGTSLRAIVKMIIDQLPLDEQQGFLDTLNRAGEGTATREGQKQQLLNDLAHAIREEVVVEDASELEGELVKQLPHLFQDPHMREAHFLRDDTIIADIVDHIFAPSNALNRPDKRRLFDEQDLPLGGADFINASKHARNALRVIELEPGVSQPLAVQIINRNLDKAVARTLSFSGDRVEELMARLRAHLKRQGKELILLVEEFARLQGIDRALLQAITSHGDSDQCKMRSAIAVTTGFFGSVAETAYMRTTHIVDMDRSAGRAHGQEVTKASLSEFASRYLNAARLGRADIDAWSKFAEPGEEVPTKCAACPHEPECHATFGAVDRIGLYPFTATALWNAASRADESMPESLNPRVLQNNLLVEVLDNFAPSIRTGEFPPYRLLEKLGGPKVLDLAARGLLQNLNPQTAERWIAFLELYDGSGEINNLPSELRDAFGVPEIPGNDQLAPADVTAPVVDPNRTGQAPIASRENLAIESWINGSGLDQNVAAALRTLIFGTVADAIDWDMLGLERSSFVGKTGRAFQANSVSFDRQTTTIQSHLKVKLRIPGDHIDAVTTGAALQGLLRASKQQFRWDFDSGDRMLSAFLDCVDVWARSVEDQLRTICAPYPGWNQSIAALQLLCIGAAIGGKMKLEPTVGEMIDAAFSVWPPECPGAARNLRSVYERISKQREKLVGHARAQISSMKGGRVGAMLNPKRFVSGIRDLRKAKWRLTLQSPEDEKGEFAALAKLYKEIQTGLSDAVTTEWNLRCQWLEEMEKAFGPEATRATIVAALSEAREAAMEAGIASAGSAKTLADLLDRFKLVHFDDALTAARALSKQDDPLSALPHFGRGRRNAVDAGTELKQAATVFLNAVDQNLNAYSADHGAEHAAIDTNIATIDKALGHIQADLLDMASDKEDNVNAA